MNTKLYNIYGIICIFPVWIFKLNLDNIDLLTFFIFFTILPIFIHILFVKIHTRKQSNIIYIWLSLITFYSIDQNLGLWNFSQDFFLNFRQFGRSVCFSILSILFLNLSPSFEFSYHIFYSRNGFNLIVMSRLKKLNQRALRKSSQNSKIIHFIPW